MQDFLIGAGVVAGYMAVGVAAARVTFVMSLGDSPRERRDYSYRFDKVVRKSRDYTHALGWAWTAFFSWPFFLVGVLLFSMLRLPVRWVTGETPTEKKKRLALERAKADKETARLEAELLEAGLLEDK